MKRTSFIIFILFSLFTMLVSGCGKQVSWQGEISSVSKENKYVLLYIDDGSSKESTAIRDSLKENVSNMPKQFRFIEVNYNKEKDSLLKFLKASGISKFPLALLIAPNGAITGSFTQKCNSDELKASVVTKRESEILLSLQNGNIAILCIHKGQTEDLNRVKSELKVIETNFKGLAVVHYLDTEDKNDMPFIKKLPEASANITVFTAVPPGSITAKLEGDQINNGNLLQVIQSSCSSGSCGSGGCN